MELINDLLPAITAQPGQAEMILQVVPMPRDCQRSEIVSNEWIMGYMDSAGGVIARQYIKDKKVVTISVDTMEILEMVPVRSLVSFCGEIVHVGPKSITIEVIAYARIQREDINAPIKVAEAYFTYVPVAEDGKSSDALN